MNRSNIALVGSGVFFAASLALLVASLNQQPRIANDVSEIEPECQSPLPGTHSPVPINNEVLVGTPNYERHVANLKKAVGPEFTIIIEKPFVVIGDQSPRDVKRWATGTIRWAVSQIKGQYFKNDPDHIIDIWLFKDSESYQANAKSQFGKEPTTPYGYYSPSDKALVMNISTGGGTLVHEIVHPFMAENFESCPAWFNEGLASLYEQSAERDGKIVGLTNWRLRGLQLAIKDKLLGSFEKLMSTSDREFYEGDATNYAQARYLCYWLQEHERLHKYYHSFVRNVADDPKGIKTLKSVLGTEDLDRFQQSWEKYVMKLRFPN